LHEESQSMSFCCLFQRHGSIGPTISLTVQRTNSANNHIRRLTATSNKSNSLQQTTESRSPTMLVQAHSRMKPWAHLITGAIQEVYTCREALHARGKAPSSHSRHRSWHEGADSSECSRQQTKNKSQAWSEKWDRRLRAAPVEPHGRDTMKVRSWSNLVWIEPGWHHALAARMTGWYTKPAPKINHLKTIPLCTSLQPHAIPSIPYWIPVQPANKSCAS
jgi:hypothetical protein